MSFFCLLKGHFGVIRTLGYYGYYGKCKPVPFGFDLVNIGQTFKPFNSADQPKLQRLALVHLRSFFMCHTDFSSPRQDKCRMWTTLVHSEQKQSNAVSLLTRMLLIWRSRYDGWNTKCVAVIYADLGFVLNKMLPSFFPLASSNVFLLVDFPTCPNCFVKTVHPKDLSNLFCFSAGPFPSPSNGILLFPA